LKSGGLHDLCGNFFFSLTCIQGGESPQAGQTTNHARLESTSALRGLWAAMGKSKHDQSLTHEEIWDDSALVQSWDEAVEEYKVCLLTSHVTVI
jgi:hypothetical protein